MNEPTLSEKELIQEDEYCFPYHYLDLSPRFASSLLIPQSSRSLVRELLRPYRGQRVLDAGCGDGRFCYDLRNENLQLTGVDYSRKAINFARAFSPNLEFAVADLAKYRPEKRFDVILLMEVIEHLKPDQVSTVLSNVSSCLANDGKLIITVPSKRIARTPKHCQHFGVDDLKRIVRPHFRVVEMYGHIRRGLKSTIFRFIMMGQFCVGALRPGLMCARIYHRLAKRLLRSIEKCSPEEGEGLIAVCRKTAVEDLTGMADRSSG